MRVLVCGASRGIGRLLLEHCGHQGAQVWGISRHLPEPTPKMPGGEPYAWSTADVARPSDLRRAAEALGTAWGGLDALIVCAAVHGPIGPAMQAPPDAWANAVRINLEGTYYAIHTFYPLLQRATHRAKIVCFSGGGGASPRPFFSAYAAAKAGVVRLVETLAGEWAADATARVDINALAPGAVATALTDDVIAAGAHKAGAQEVARAQETQQTGGTPPHKLLGLMDFLLSPTSDGLTGKLLSAAWDPWEQFPQQLAHLQKSDKYTLRRVV